MSPDQGKEWLPVVQSVGPCISAGSPGGMAGCVVFSLPEEFQPQYGTEAERRTPQGTETGDSDMYAELLKPRGAPQTYTWYKTQGPLHHFCIGGRAPGHE